MSRKTIYDVAEKAEVSLATVSRVLNNSPKVRTSTREKIERVMKELDYQPNLVARTIASQKSSTVAVLVNDISRASIGELTTGIIDVARLYGFAVKIITIDYNTDLEEVYNKLSSEIVGGILRLDDRYDESHLEFVKNFKRTSGIPTLFVNMIINDLELPCVSLDFENAAYDAVKELASKGCEKIVLCTSSNISPTKLAVVSGYEKALKEDGLETNMFLITGHALETEEEVARFLDENKFDGLICSRDSMAVMFMNEFLKRGIKVPEDVQVIGFQGTKLARMYRPALTYMKTPVYDIGAIAMRMMARMNRGDQIVPEYRTLSHDLIYRGTTK